MYVYLSSNKIPSLMRDALGAKGSERGKEKKDKIAPNRTMVTLRETVSQGGEGRDARGWVGTLP